MAELINAVMPHSVTEFSYRYANETEANMRTPLKNFVPRMPLGPSENRREGILYSGRALVCHISMPACNKSALLSYSFLGSLKRNKPASKSTFSDRLSLLKVSSISKSAMLTT